MRSRSAVLLLFLSGTTACFEEPPLDPSRFDGGDDDGSTTDSDGATPIAPQDDGTTAADEGDDAETTGASNDSPTTDDGSNDVPTTDGPTRPECGDGVQDADEACDDGNFAPGDGCSPACTLETTGCAAQSLAIADDPIGGMAICADADQSVCEEDFAQLCAPGWHLCSALEHQEKREGWAVDLQGHRALGVIRCRAAGGAGHYTVATIDADASDNCQIGSSRAECPSAFGCNETLDYALCCAAIPTCGNGVVDGPLEECDDGNAFEADACSNVCASTTGTGPHC